MKPVRRPISGRIKAHVRERTGDVCEDCCETPEAVADRLQADGKHVAAMEYHHRLPVALTGSNDPENIAYLCWYCHQDQTKVDRKNMAKPLQLAKGGKKKQPLNWRKANEPKLTKMERLAMDHPVT